jgi:hypothetical protein
MPDSPGPLPPLAVNGALLAMPLLPLLTALGLAALALSGRPWRVARIWSAGPTLASTSLLAFLGAYVALGREPALLTLGHGVTLVRVGWLDVGLNIAFDRLTGAFALAGGAFFAATLSWLGREGASGPRPLAALALGNLASGAFFVALMADAAPAFCLGAGVSAFACAWLAARAAALPRALGDFAPRALGDALLALGLVALSASFAANAPDEGAPLRVVAVSRPDDETRPNGARPASGTLTLTSLPGALVRTEGSPSLSALTSPFVRSSAPAGSYRGRVVPGPGSPDLAFGPTRVSEGTETRLVVAGPTVVFRSMQEQLSLLPAAAAGPAGPAGAKGRAAAAAGDAPADGALARVGVTLAAAGVLVRGAYAGAGRRRAKGGGLGWLGAAPAALLGAYLLLRLSFAWHVPSASFLGLGFVVALAASAGARWALRPADAAAAFAALCLGLAVAAAGVGASGAVFAFGLAPSLAAAALLARSEPLAADLDPSARPLSPLWALPFAALGVVGASSFAGRLPLASAAGLAVLALLVPTSIAAAILAARTIGAASFTAARVVARAPRSEGVALACVIAPLGLLGADAWFGLARRNAPALQWAPAAAWAAPRPLAAIGAAVAIGLVAWFVARAALGRAAPSAAPAAVDLPLRKVTRALAAALRALFRATTALDRGLWGDHQGARASRRSSGVW